MPHPKYDKELEISTEEGGHSDIGNVWIWEVGNEDEGRFHIGLWHARDNNHEEDHIELWVYPNGGDAIHINICFPVSTAPALIEALQDAIDLASKREPIMNVNP